MKFVQPYNFISASVFGNSSNGIKLNDVILKIELTATVSGHSEFPSSII